MTKTSAASSARLFSSQITKEELEAGLEKVGKFRKYQQMQATVKPKTFSDVLGTGVELHTPRNPIETAVFSGMPAEQASRTVIIAPRINKTLQSGGSVNHLWQITWKNEERWSNPLMGWTSTADPMSNVKLTFDTQEEAVAFAQKNGWKYEARAPVPETTVELGTFSYSHNFLPKKVMAKVRAEGPRTTQFRYSKSCRSNWFMPLTYAGDGEVEQHGPRQKK